MRTHKHSSKGANDPKPSTNEKDSTKYSDHRESPWVNEDEGVGKIPSNRGLNHPTGKFLLSLFEESNITISRCLGFQSSVEI